MLPLPRHRLSAGGSLTITSPLVIIVRECASALSTTRDICEKIEKEENEELYCSATETIRTSKNMSIQYSELSKEMGDS